MSDTSAVLNSGIIGKIILGSTASSGSSETSSILGVAVLGKMALGDASSGGSDIPDIPDTPDTPDIPDVPDIPSVSPTGRYLIGYLPPYMQEYLEIKSIMETEQSEINALWFACERTLADQYIMDATEYGVARWESMLNISPKATDTLDERKFRILARLNQELPYTLTKMKELLTVMCGADGFVIDLQANEYHIDIKLAVGNHNNYNEVQKILNTMIPANLTQSVSLMYNSHKMVGLLRHMDLSPYTHEHIRNEVLPNA